jgi:hypothetical protein
MTEHALKRKIPESDDPIEGDQSTLTKAVKLKVR